MDSEDRFLRAVISLQGNPDFEIVRAHIRKTYAALCFGFHSIPSDQLDKHAGRAAALSRLLVEIDVEYARKELEKMTMKLEPPKMV